MVIKKVKIIFYVEMAISEMGGGVCISIVVKQSIYHSILIIAGYHYYFDNYLIIHYRFFKSTDDEYRKLESSNVV